MSKQEVIREVLEGVSGGGLSVDEGLRELGILGVVIKADRELPNCDWTDLIIAPAYRKARNDMVEAGYVAVESLT